MAILAGLIAPIGAGAASKPCNGHPALCARTLDQVVLPGTHNSMSAEELGWNLPNQLFGIPGQLARGARAFLIDTHYGRPAVVDGKNVIVNVSREDGEQSDAKVFLCHSSCEKGASGLVEVFAGIRNFLRTNPREVLVFVNEDYVAPSDFEAAVNESGLSEFTYRRPLGPWPTLAEMISSGDRVLFLAQSEVGNVPWYHLAYEGPMRETPYTFNAYQESDTALLTAPEGLAASCRPSRGGNTGGLFLMNHWILGSGVTPLKQFAQVVNSREALVNRARACERVRGKLPTILAVDFFGIGDEVGAALELNGLKPWGPPKLPGRLTMAQIRKKARTLCRKRKAGPTRRTCVKKQIARLKKRNARVGFRGT